MANWDAGEFNTFQVLFINVRRLELSTLVGLARFIQTGLKPDLWITFWRICISFWWSELFDQNIVEDWEIWDDAGGSNNLQKPSGW